MSSGLSVALLALPQSMAYAMIVGLPVHTGILAMLIGTLVFSLIGYSKHLISGPTNATALLVQAGCATLYSEHVAKFTDVPSAILFLQFLSLIVFFTGCIQLVVSMLKLGSFTRFISRSVMMGYLLGVTLSIWSGQAYTWLGIAKPKKGLALYQELIYLARLSPSLHLTSFIGGLSCLVFVLWLKKRNIRLPRSILMLVAASTLLFLARKFLPHSSIAQLQTLEADPFKPFKLVHLPIIYFDLGLIKQALVISFALAIFSIFELHSVSRMLTAKNAQVHSDNRDIFAIGIGNLFCSFFSGALPCSGSPSRSMFNYTSGAKNRLSSFFVFMGVLFLVWLLYPLFHSVPKIALSSLLILIGYEIIDFKLLKICLKATKRDAWVLVTTFLSCLFLPLDVALYIGVALSLILYLRLAAQTNILEYVFTEQGHFQPIKKSKERVEKRIRILNMEGSLFFGSVDGLHQSLHPIVKDPEVEILILRLSHVHHMDASICYFLEVFAKDLKKQGKSLYLCEMIHTTSRVVNESPLLKHLGSEYLYERDHHAPNRATQLAFTHALEKLNEKSESKDLS